MANSKQDWEIKTLEEVCDFYNGLWKGKKLPFETVNVIRNTNFTKEGQLDDSDIAVLDVEEKQFQKRQLKYGDIILEKSGGGPKQPVGRVIIFNKKDGKYSFSNFTSVIRVNDSSKLDFIYLHKLLHHLYISGYTEKLQKHTTGIRNLDFTEYKKLEVPLPPITEQKRIVGILNEKFGTIEELKKITERQIVDAKELFESEVSEIFSEHYEQEEKLPLSEMTSLITKGSSPKWQGIKYVKEGEGVLFVTSKNVGIGTLLMENATYLEKRFNEIQKRSILQHGDVLTNIVGASIGRTAIYNLEKVANTNQAVCIMRCNEKLQNQFLVYLLNSKYFIEILHANEVNNARANLSLAFFSNLEIPALPIDKQIEIIKKLDELSEKTKELEAIFRRKIADLEELKKSYLEQAFSGNL